MFWWGSLNLMSNNIFLSDPRSFHLLFFVSGEICHIMYSIIEKMMTSQLKKWFESCYETFINFMIYSVLLFQTKTFNSLSLCHRFHLLLIFRKPRLCTQAEAVCRHEKENSFANPQLNCPEKGKYNYNYEKGKLYISLFYHAFPSEPSFPPSSPCQWSLLKRRSLFFKFIL